MQPSEHQQAVINATVRTSDNLLVQACAGAGKTTLLRMLCEAIRAEQPGASVLVVAFNKSIQRELEQRMPPGIACATLHSHGFRTIRNNTKGVRVENNKLKNILDINLASLPEDDRMVIRGDMLKVVPLVLSTLTDPQNVEAIQQVLDRVGASIDSPHSLEWTAPIVQAMHAQEHFITFDEMITRPITHGLTPPKFDFVLVDECQDLNEAQQELVARTIKPGTGRMIAVGDRFQSIYGFRGADPEAISTMLDRFNMRELRLPVTYRCPLSVVRLAQAVAGADIITECEGAQEGVVINRTALRSDIDQTMHELRNGDMVLCRVNAPLMGFALRLIREGRKAVVRGRDIGRELANLVKRMKVQTVPQLAEKLGEWASRETKKAMAEDKPTKVQAINDKVETIMAVTEYCETDDASEVVNKLETIFSDDTGGVVFSSIHRAKGLEAENVVILAPELLPHPMARDAGEAALVQERNLEYVAYTRALRRLILQPLKP